jgi:hypothetical protein
VGSLITFVVWEIGCGAVIFRSPPTIQFTDSQKDGYCDYSLYIWARILLIIDYSLWSFGFIIICLGCCKESKLIITPIRDTVQDQHIIIAVIHPHGTFGK